MCDVINGKHTDPKRRPHLSTAIELSECSERIRETYRKTKGWEYSVSWKKCNNSEPSSKRTVAISYFQATKCSVPVKRFWWTYLITGLSALSSAALFKNLGSSPGSECSRRAHMGSSWLHRPTTLARFGSTNPARRVVSRRNSCLQGNIQKL